MTSLRIEKLIEKTELSCPLRHERTFGCVLPFCLRHTKFQSDPRKHKLNVHRKRSRRPIEIYDVRPMEIDDVPSKSTTSHRNRRRSTSSNTVSWCSTRSFCAPFITSFFTYLDVPKVCTGRLKPHYNGAARVRIARIKFYDAQRAIFVTSFFTYLDVPRGWKGRLEQHDNRVS